MANLTHCRCGLKFEKNGCPKFWLAEESSPKHDQVAQQINQSTRNWDVVPEGGKFRPYAGNDPGPELFDSEEEAWKELDLIYHGHKDWDEGEVFDERSNLQEAR